MSERVLLYGLQDSLSVFCSLQTDLLADYISVLPLHAGSCFRLGLYTQKFILVPQLHLVLYRRCKNPMTHRVHKPPLMTFKSFHKKLSLALQVHTFPHGFLFLYRLLLFAKVFLIQGLLLTNKKQNGHHFGLILNHFILNM